MAVVGQYPVKKVICVQAIVAWLAPTIGLFALIVFGPRLWASQITANHAYALPIFGVGELFVLAVFWPIFARSLAVCGAMLVVMPIWTMIAASLQHAGFLPAIELALKLDAVLLLFATIWAIAPQVRGGRAVVWSMLLIGTLGWSTIDYLTTDFTSESASVSHFHPAAS